MHAPRPVPRRTDPRAKQYVGARLANSALALRYKFDLTWRSPAYDSAASGGGGGGGASGGGGGGGGSYTQLRRGATTPLTVASAVVQLTGVSSLAIRPPWNYRLDLQASAAPGLPSAQTHTQTPHPRMPAAPHTGAKQLTAQLLRAARRRLRVGLSPPLCLRVAQRERARRARRACTRARGGTAARTCRCRCRARHLLRLGRHPADERLRSRDWAARPPVEPQHHALVGGGGMGCLVQAGLDCWR